MKKLFEFLASLKLAVILLLLLLAGLSAGTIVETRVGAEIAGQQVYYSWWFLGLQGLLAVTLALSLAAILRAGSPTPRCRWLARKCCPRCSPPSCGR